MLHFPTLHFPAGSVRFSEVDSPKKCKAVWRIHEGCLFFTWSDIMLKKYIALPAVFVTILLMLSACAGPSHRSASSHQNSLENPSLAFSPSASHDPTAHFLRDPDLVYGKLPNGMRYILMQNTTPEDRVSMHLNVQAGSMQEKADQRGLAHYLEHMLFNGSTHFKPGELIEYFQSIGMMFGADANAHTGFFETVYDILLPTGDPESLEKGLLVLQDYAEGALLLESEIDRERGVILAEKRERDSVSFRTFKASLEFELPGSRIAQRMPIGLDSVIENADRSLLKSYYDTWYRPETMMIVMVGDFDTTTAEALIKKRFSGIEARAPQPNPLDPAENRWEPHMGEKAFYHFEPEAGNTEVSIGTAMWRSFDMETEESLKSRVLNRLADVVVQNRLSEMIRKEEAPMSDAGIYSGTFLQNVRYSGISAECEPDRWDESLAYLEQTLRQALTYGFTASEVLRAKSDFVLGLETAVKEASTRKSTPLARELISSVNRKRFVFSPQQELELLKPYVESVTPDMLHNAFKESWESSHRLIQVTGNAVIDDKADLLATYNASQGEAVAAIEEKNVPHFPYLPKPTVQQSMSPLTSHTEDAEGCKENDVLKKTCHLHGLDIWVVEFANGVRLNIKPTDFEKGELRFQANLGGGKVSEPEDQPGLAMATQSVINDSGVGGLTVDALATALAGRNLSIGFGVDDDAFHFAGSAAPDEVELLFQVLYTYLVDPAFRPEALSLLKSRYGQMFQKISRTPDGVMRYRGERFLAGGDTRFGMPTMAQVEAITLSDIKEWLTPALSSAPLEISVVGDLDVDEVIASAGDWIGHLPKREAVMHLKKKAPNVTTECFSSTKSIRPQKTSVKQLGKKQNLKSEQKQSIKRASKNQLLMKSGKGEVSNRSSLRTTPTQITSTLEVMPTGRRPIFPKGKNADFQVKSRLDKGLVLLAFPTDDFWNIQQTRRLNILAKLFSERLRKSLREELGATYSPYAYNHASRVYEGYGVLRGVVAVSPDTISPVVEQMARIADDLAQNGVNQHELDLVLEPILTYIKDMVKTNGYWLDSVLVGSGIHPEQLEWAETIMMDYQSISADEITQAASKFLNREYAARIIIQPSLE